MNQNPKGNYQIQDFIAAQPTIDSYIYIVLYKPLPEDSWCDYVTAWYTNGEPYRFSCAKIHEIKSSGREYLRKGKSERFYIDDFLWCK